MSPVLSGKYWYVRKGRPKLDFAQKIAVLKHSFGKNTRVSISLHLMIGSNISTFPDSVDGYLALTSGVFLVHADWVVVRRYDVSHSR